MERVVAYIDGYNLYHGLRDKGWRRYYWLNLQEMVRFRLRPHQALMHTRYFTTIVPAPVETARRQATYLEALQTLPCFTLHYGKFLSDERTCRHCGYSYTTHHEKMTDVNIAVELLTDAFHDRFDMAFLVGADSDMVGLLRRVRALFPRKRLIVAFPPGRHSVDLANAATGFISINRDALSKSLFPDEVPKADGYILRRPAEWT